MPRTSGSSLETTMTPMPWRANRPWPVLATRDAKGLISLDANGDALSYSMNGTTWQTFAAPFAFPRGGLLQVRSRAKSGQTLESVVPFDAFVDRRAWKATASSFQGGEGNVEHIIDGDPGTFWHSQYSPANAPTPHFVIVDMAAPLAIKGITLTPRPDGSNGRLRDYELFLSDNAKNFGAPVLGGTLLDQGTVQTISLPAARTARYLKLLWKSEYSGQNLGSLAELSVVPAN